MQIQCPGCGLKTGFLLTQSTYEGPFRCGKCRGLFTIRIANRKLKSIEPLSEEEFEKGQQVESSDTEEV